MILFNENYVKGIYQQVSILLDKKCQPCYCTARLVECREKKVRLIAKNYAVDTSDVACGDATIVVLVAVDDRAGVVVEHKVVKCSHVGTVYMAIAVDIA